MPNAKDCPRGPLAGLRIVEFAGIGPAPFACMLLADLGAEIVHVMRAGDPPPDPRDPLLRGRKCCIALDLKAPADAGTAAALIAAADILVEGFRPGVMERLGLGPEPMLTANPRLIYGRMTGWGQSGPRAQDAGHDINYLAPSGALAAIGPYGGKPIPPLNLVGDFGGGALYLVMGILAAVIERQTSGRGQVVDAAICDGVTSLMAMVASYAQSGPIPWSEERGTNIGDGGAHFYNTYECRDGHYVAVGAIEPQFYRALREVAGLETPDFDVQLAEGEKARDLIDRTAAVFRTRDRDEWCRLAEGRDACIAPVLTMSESPADPHNVARGVHVRLAGVTQPAPAPRLSRTPGEARLGTGIVEAKAALAAWRSPAAAER